MLKEGVNDDALRLRVACLGKTIYNSYRYNLHVFKIIFLIIYISFCPWLHMRKCLASIDSKVIISKTWILTLIFINWKKNRHSLIIIDQLSDYFYYFPIRIRIPSSSKFNISPKGNQTCDHRLVDSSCWKFIHLTLK